MKHKPDNKLIKQITIVIIVSLVLIGADLLASRQNGGVTIVQDGNGLYFLRPDEDDGSGHISLRARVDTENGSYEKKYNVILHPHASGDPDTGDENVSGVDDGDSSMSAEELITYEMRGIVSGLNDDSSARKVLLPSKLSSGETIEWSVERSTHTVLILFTAGMLCLLLYRRSYTPLRRQREAELYSITRQLPEFVNRLVLLLNAGLALNTAFERTIEESLKFGNGDDDYFTIKIRELYIRVKQTNGSINREFRNFAKFAGNNDLMRISNIISDNISKGVELTHKLQHESEILRINRKRACEERGRIAETRLTLPLTIFLLVLIVITVSPALLEL